MPLPPGTPLGTYEILAPIGAGGMGEVYRARDNKLDRDVAIKVLPQSVATDPDTLARFEREAKAVAALSHPNILSIFDFGVAAGISYAVMELLVGETLRGRLDAGPITQKQAVDYALQVARGLSAAHGKGIVHRDLKPENLFVSRDGHVKILDFGLAKRVETTAEMTAPTRSGHTEPGTIMGTAGYMSPEQVKGLPVDHRSDIFSFGTILYELLSGKRAFKRATNAETMAAIMRDEPPELSESGRNIPPALDRIVKHCLEKDRDHRFQSARDIAFNLMELAQASTSVTSGAREIAPPISAAGFWVAVLPFKRSGDAETETFADGLGEEITTGLSRFRYLSVVANASAARLKGEAGDERSLGAKLGARYVLEGSIRKGGSAIRVSAQLVDTQTGGQLWAETYNRDLQTSSIFSVQDDVAARIVATVADSYGVLVHAMRSAMRRKDDVDLTPVEWQFQYFAYREQITPAAHAALKARLERVVERDDRRSDVWACIAQIHVDEYAFGFPGSDATSLDRALAAGRRAVELDRANQFALVALAQVHFFRRDLAAFGPAAERAMTLNPLNTDAVGILGLQIVHTREFERGTAIVRRAMALNANHAGWMHFAPLWDHFHKGEFEQALECANRVDVPGLFWPFLVVASACGHLGRRAEAEAAVRDLLALDPEFAAHARANIESWHFASGLMEPLLEGLRKAGLEISDRPRPPAADSGAARAEEGFWVAVLPFKYSGGNADLAALADGLSEDIVTGLSRFSYLKVIARSSTSRYVNEAVDVRAAGRELGARYVMEGSLRQAGAKSRLAVQLVDATTGAHLWAENYERSFSPEGVFELQDDLVPRIVSTCADRFGVLARSISDAVRSGAPGQVGPYEALMRGFGYHHRLTPTEHAEAREALERAVEGAPSNADCWAMLSWVYSHEHAHGFNVLPGSLDRALVAAGRAVDIAPSNPLAQQALAVVLFFRKEIAGCLSAAERALALNPLDTSNEAMFLITFTGGWDRGCALIRRAMELNPHHPRWYGMVLGINEYRLTHYRAVVDEVVKANSPEVYWSHMLLAAAHGQLGEFTAAAKALRDLLAQKEGFAQSAVELLDKWFDPELVAAVMDGLRKAGLEIAREETSASAAPAPDLALRRAQGVPSLSRDARSAAAESGAARADEGFWVAVLPFKYSGANADLTALADGLSEGIVTGMSRFSYLRVIARSSTSRYVNEAADVRAAGRELGARYVIEGNLRQAGGKLRLAVQLVDAVSGAHLWAETYERGFSPEAVFELQDDLVPRIVSTVADSSGVLPHSISEMLRKKGPDQLSPYEAVLRYFGYLERATPEEHAKARDALERAVENAPDQANCWATLAMVYRDEHTHAFNVRPDPLGRALAAAHRAVEAAPSNHLAHLALACALFFRGEIVAFRSAAERTIALNPMDSSTSAYLGTLMLHEGDWERGCALVERARQLNPNHPGWYWFAAFWDAYRKQDYRGALEVALKINMPGDFYVPAVIAAAYGQLGERDAARAALQQLLAMKPDFAATAREEFEKWFGPGELVEHFLDGLRKAGLEIAATRPSAADSGVARADEGFWVAVLPFKYTGGNADFTALADGLSEDIVTGLSRFSYLKVIARSSTSRYVNEAVDVRAAGRELGARYVMEGTLRQAGPKLRLAVQLVDATTGAHLWADNYERSFSPETVFELQDDLVPRIVSMVAGMNGSLPRSMSATLRSRAPEQLSPYEAVLRSFGYLERVTPEELAVARSGLELAVGRAPGYADAWAMLALLCFQDYAQSFNLQADSLARGSDAARRAIEAAPSSPLASFSHAQALFFQKQVETFRNVAERAAALNPMDGNSIAFLGELLTYAGDSDRGLTLAARAKQLNPNHPGWYWYADFYNAYLRGDDRSALQFALKVNLPGHWGTHVATAAACGQLGQRDAAEKALRELLVVRPNLAATVRGDMEKWWGPEYVDRLIDGLRKAGLDVAAPAQTGTVKPGATFAEPETTIGIAVLPFSDLSSAKDQDYLCEGMAEEIMNALVQIGGIRVASRTSAFRAKKAGSDLAAVARALSVGHILEGSVRTSGTRLRVTAQLTEVASGYQVWSERFDREAIDVFAVQDEITAGVVEAVKARLAHGEHKVRTRPQVGDLEAYQLYLKGRHLRYTKNDHGGALRCFEQSTTLDPSHGPSWVGLADVNVLAAGYGLKPSREAYAAAKAALQTAARLQEASAEALYVEAMIAFGERRWKDSERFLARATEAQPGHVQARCWTGILHSIHGRTDEAVGALEQARQIDPLAPYPYAMTGLCLLQMQRPEEAGPFLDQALAFDGDNILALWVSGAAQTALRLFDPAIARLERAVALSNRGSFLCGTLGWALASAGKTDAAKAVLAGLRARPTPAATALPEAWMLGAFGDREGAWHVLDRASDEKQLLVPLTGLPGFDPLRADPRFGAFLARVGLPPAHPAAVSRRADSSDGPDVAVALAVMPFSDLSSAKDQEYLCEGMAEEIMNALVQVGGIRVASRTSAFRARKEGSDLAAIARALSVGHLLEGSVRTSGSRLRVTAQLTDVASGYQLWSERFDREAIDVFAIQDEIASGVVNAVKARLGPRSGTVHVRAQAHDLNAYRSYLKGRHLRSVEDFGGAIAAFEEAVRLDPAHAPSWTGLAEITVLAAHMGMIPPRAACTSARKMLATAKELQGESADGLHAEAFAAFLERRWDEMETSWHRALELQPDHVLALGSFAITLCARQRLDEALPLFERARAADPLASFPYTLAGWGLLMCGQPEQGLRQIEDAFTFQKEDASAICALSIAKVALGKLDEGIAAGERAVAVTRRAPFFVGVLGWALAAAGRSDDARAVLDELRVRPAGSPTAVSEAWLLAALGEVDEAFDVLARAEEEHQGLLCYTGLPGFDPLRSEPRFAALMARLELSPA